MRGEWVEWGNWCYVICVKKLKKKLRVEGAMMEAENGAVEKVIDFRSIIRQAVR